jgi:hypothetical protein
VISIGLLTERGEPACHINSNQRGSASDMTVFGEENSSAQKGHTEVCS